VNERIRELGQQLGMTDSEGKFYSPNYEILAEAIVRECIRVPYDMWDKAELNADVAVKIEHRIKDHFGVES
jgi:hypothetical protein